eukprot:7207303-Pyramimonas_sp.AAC.1
MQRNNCGVPGRAAPPGAHTAGTTSPGVPRRRPRRHAWPCERGCRVAPLRGAEGWKKLWTSL